MFSSRPRGETDTNNTRLVSPRGQLMILLKKCELSSGDQPFKFLKINIFLLNLLFSIKMHALFAYNTYGNQTRLHFKWGTYSLCSLMIFKEPGQRPSFCRPPPENEQLGIWSFPWPISHSLLPTPARSAATGPERRRQIDVAFISYLELQRLSFLSIDEKTVAVVCLLVQPLTAHTQPEFAQDISESQDCLSELGNRSYSAWEQKSNDFL